MELYFNRYDYYNILDIIAKVGFGILILPKLNPVFTESCAGC